MSYNPDLREWAKRPLPSTASFSERQSHRELNEAIRQMETLSVMRGRFRIARSTVYLAGACLFGLGFITATWITALIRS